MQAAIDPSINIHSQPELSGRVVNRMRLGLGFTLFSFLFAIWAAQSLSLHGVTGPAQSSLLMIAISLYGILAGYLLTLRLVMGDLGSHPDRVPAWHFPSFPGNPIGNLGFLRDRLNSLRRRIIPERDRQSEHLHLVRKAIHDLKSPLFAIHGYAELMTNPSLQNNDEFMDTCQRTIISQVDHLSNLLDDLSTVTNLVMDEAGSNKESISLSTLLKLLCTEFRERTGRDIVLNLPDTEVVAQVDPIRIREALWNLIDNALRYSPAGEAVEISLTLDEASSAVRLAIKDHGCGINPADQARLFLPFVRLNETVVQDQPGTGLGLFIAQKIIRQHRGEILVSSVPGQGSTFEIQLPVPRA